MYLPWLAHQPSRQQPRSLSVVSSVTVHRNTNGASYCSHQYIVRQVACQTLGTVLFSGRCFSSWCRVDEPNHTVQPGIADSNQNKARGEKENTWHRQAVNRHSCARNRGQCVCLCVCALFLFLSISLCPLFSFCRGLNTRWDLFPLKFCVLGSLLFIWLIIPYHGQHEHKLLDHNIHNLHTPYFTKGNFFTVYKIFLIKIFWTFCSCWRLEMILIITGLNSQTYCII